MKFILEYKDFIDKNSNYNKESREDIKIDLFLLNKKL